MNTVTDIKAFRLRQGRSLPRFDWRTPRPARKKPPTWDSLPWLNGKPREVQAKCLKVHVRQWGDTTRVKLFFATRDNERFLGWVYVGRKAVSASGGFLRAAEIILGDHPLVGEMLDPIELFKGKWMLVWVGFSHHPNCRTHYLRGMEIRAGYA